VTLGIADATDAMSGYSYRFAAVNSHGETASDSAVLTVGNSRLGQAAGITLDNENNIYVTDAGYGAGLGLPRLSAHGGCVGRADV
jgi:hypothetical protein